MSEQEDTFASSPELFLRSWLSGYSPGKQNTAPMPKYIRGPLRALETDVKQLRCGRPPHAKRGEYVLMSPRFIYLQYNLLTHPQSDIICIMWRLGSSPRSVHRSTHLCMQTTHVCISGHIFFSLSLSLSLSLFSLVEGAALPQSSQELCPNAWLAKQNQNQIPPREVAPRSQYGVWFCRNPNFCNPPAPTCP